MIEINDRLSIGEEEISFQTSRSGGPGGQNVNKVETRVTLLFDLANSPRLSAEEKARIQGRLGGRINRAGVLRIVCQKHRSQLANRDEALARFAELLRAALTQAPPRRATKVSRGARERRLSAKKRRATVKKERAIPPDFE